MNLRQLQEPKMNLRQLQEPKMTLQDNPKTKFFKAKDKRFNQKNL